MDRCNTDNIGAQALSDVLNDDSMKDLNKGDTTVGKAFTSTSECTLHFKELKLTYLIIS